MTRRSLAFRLAACTTAAVALAVSRVGRAADPPPSAAKPAQSLDDQLLQGLDKGLDNGLGNGPDNGLDGKLLGGSDDKPATEPAVAKPAVAKPAVAKPAVAKPAVAKPATTKPAATKPAGEKPSKETAPKDKKPSPLVDPLDEALSNSLSAGEDIGSPGEDSKNPLARIVVQMRQVQQRLAASKSDRLTQQEQQRISNELKSLVEQLAQQAHQQSQADQSASQQSSRGKPKPGGAPAGKASPGDPNKDPSKGSSNKLRKSHVDRPDPAVAREAVAKELDRLHLPAKEREEMLQGAPDEFLPGHESSIEEYFKRLVEQEDAKP